MRNMAISVVLVYNCDICDKYSVLCVDKRIGRVNKDDMITTKSSFEVIAERGRL